MNKAYFSDCEEIVDAVKKYLEASNRGDASIMKPFFHKDAVIFWGDPDPDARGHEIQGFFDYINKSSPDPDRNPPCYIDILDMTETTAVTKIVEK